MKLMSWFCFLVGVAIVVWPFNTMLDQIQRYPLDFGQSELAAKFYVRGFGDKTAQSLVAVVFFFLALLTRSMVKHNRSGSEQPPA